MTIDPTLTEVARTLQAEYDKAEPFRLALNKKVEEVINIIKIFLEKNHEYTHLSGFYWVGRHYHVNITGNDLGDEGIYFESIYADTEPYYLSFVDMENIEVILIEEQEKILAAKRQLEINEKARKRAKLEADLAKIDSLEAQLITPKRDAIVAELAQLNKN